jgi:hypothetical protein
MNGLPTGVRWSRTGLRSRPTRNERRRVVYAAPFMIDANANTSQGVRRIFSPTTYLNIGVDEHVGHSDSTTSVANDSFNGGACRVVFIHCRDPLAQLALSILGASTVRCPRCRFLIFCVIFASFGFESIGCIDPCLVFYRIKSFLAKLRADAGLSIRELDVKVRTSPSAIWRSESSIVSAALRILGAIP